MKLSPRAVTLLILVYSTTDIFKPTDGQLSATTVHVCQKLDIDYHLVRKDERREMIMS